ncbi:MAG: type II toxin-antitoxin system prevent-host-death family antitoxin [Burkholderiaceae bacterium]|nr:type II toxin-antitoxin system prevent-host-death family antitoxin [Burkholderiaceae bacterium]
MAKLTVSVPRGGQAESGHDPPIGVPGHQADLEDVVGEMRNCGATAVARPDRISYNALNCTINCAVAMNTISANDLKTKGVGAIDQALRGQREATITVRGQVKYVVMSREEYARLRECELEAALAESKADLDAGRFVKESVKQHMKRLARLAP